MNTVTFCQLGQLFSTFIWQDIRFRKDGGNS